MTRLATKPRTKLVNSQTVTEVRHWSDRLFSLRITRPQSLRFRSGEFVMIGLPDDNGKPIMRAYSIASPSWDTELEFYSIKMPDGPLTSRLQRIQPGDEIILRPKPVGTLVLDALLPGACLWLFSTGTGIAPFASLIRDPETYDRFEKVILTHTVRTLPELEYGQDVLERSLNDPLVGEAASEQLIYLPTTTQETSVHMGRITDLLLDGYLFNRLDRAQINPQIDRAMVCGSMAFNLDMKVVLDGFGMHEGANSEPGEYVIEKAFVG